MEEYINDTINSLRFLEKAKVNILKQFFFKDLMNKMKKRLEWDLKRRLFNICSKCRKLIMSKKRQKKI